MSDRPFEEEGNLGNDRYMLSEGVKAHIEGVVFINGEGRAVLWLENTEEGLNDGRFSCSRSADDSYSFKFVDLQVEVLQD